MFIYFKYISFSIKNKYILYNTRIWCAQDVCLYICLLRWTQAKIKCPVIFQSLLTCSQCYKLCIHILEECFSNHLISIPSVCSPQLQWIPSNRKSNEWYWVQIYKGFVVLECSGERDGWWTHPGAKRQDQRERGEGYGGLRPTGEALTQVMLYEKDKLCLKVVWTKRNLHTCKCKGKPFTS